jgi:hypothetical protein
VTRLCGARFATVPETMRAAVIHETGPADVMKVDVSGLAQGSSFLHGYHTRYQISDITFLVI